MATRTYLQNFGVDITPGSYLLHLSLSNTNLAIPTHVVTDSICVTDTHALIVFNNKFGDYCKDIQFQGSL